MPENLATYLSEDDPRAVAINELLRHIGGMLSHPSSQRKLKSECRPEIIKKLAEDLDRLRAHPTAFDGELTLHYAAQLAVIQKLEGAGTREALEALGVWEGD